jgi:hypothetical protein
VLSTSRPRPAGPAGRPTAPPPEIAHSATCARSARVVTAAQVDQAVLQLRECPGKTAAEQVQAVLRALDLTVVANPVVPGPR